METLPIDEPQVITIRPAAVFAFVHVMAFMLCSLGFLLLAWRFWPGLVWISLLSAAFGLYRFWFIRHICYTITPEIIRIRRGIFFKRTDQVELYRVKDYILTQPFLLQVCGLMNLTLKSTDPENPIVWLRGIPASDLVDTLRGYVQQARLNNKIYEIN
ncbi:PH domain-containing protein [Mucilaginibacter ginsenosidivorax]|uniref:PH domain-containing protein n=1 Tax=Mucilaginibacter ginsenosidivorax TaxID=862126 RepID=A0A5B8W5U2_9SPHI|nr:PH domain-containing protein [Mucilaginibacter ginsenosidivorax]QEC78959.1 PH domain-containing protein [Mucilaginibacter ginsenosidivorax]